LTHDLDLRPEAIEVLRRFQLRPALIALRQSKGIFGGVKRAAVLLAFTAQSERSFGH